MASGGLTQGGYQRVSASREFERSSEGWDSELSEKFALAPKNLVRLGLVNKDNYQSESTRIGEFGARTAIEQLTGFLWMVLAIGLFRDGSFVKEANQKGTSVAAYDWSKAACENADSLFDGLPGKVGVYNRTHRVDFEELFSQTQANEAPRIKRAKKDKALAESAYAAQAAQVLDIIGKNSFMFGLGEWLAEQNERNEYYRKAVLIHPFPQDNKEAEWGYTTPYTLEELMAPAEAGAGRNIEVLGLENKGGFFTHIYTGITLMIKNK